MGAEDLDERDLEGGDLTMHKDACEIELDLEADIDIGTVDGGTPPEGETTVGDLIETRALGVGELLETHRLFKATGLLPEKTLPCGKVGALEESVFEDAFDSTEGLDHISSIVVEVPEFSVMASMSPPEGVDTDDLVLLEISADTPALVVGEGVTVLLEEGADAGNTSVPRVLEIFKGETTVLLHGLLAFEHVLGPDTLAVEELLFPREDVAVEVGDELVSIMAHS
mmetsp:Transcript_1930/g.3398  ORF Transcript_1930/g.3398 Transcript_1930/m.3398 type:complete len:226 (+) Transcript_1930:445-1122(+)